MSREQSSPIVSDLPVVSVVVPIYNTANYLSECLDSLLTQTEPNIEIICVNDGSADDSEEILTQYGARDSRVVVLKQKNQGVSIARNYGVSRAKGKYLCFVDSDDSVDPKMIEACVKVAESCNSEITRFFPSNFLKKTIRRFPQAQRLYDGRLFERVCYDEITVEQRRLFIYLAGCCGCCKTLYLRDFWNRRSICFPARVRVNEDTFVNLQAYARAQRVAFLDADYYRYRRRVGSVMHPPQWRQLGSRADAFESFRQMRSFLLSSPELFPLYEPLVALTLNSWRNIRVGLARQDQELWQEKVDELLDDFMITKALEKGFLSSSARLFWKARYGKKWTEKTFARLRTEITDSLKATERFARLTARPVASSILFKKVECRS